MLAIQKLPSVPILLILVSAIVFMIAQVHRVQAKDLKHGSQRASRRLMKELQEFYESDSHKNGVFTVELINDNIYEWEVKLFHFDTDSKLYDDFLKWKEMTGKDHIMLRVTYDENYPFSPPYVKLIYPMLLGAATVTRDICMDLLTDSGWSSAYTIEPLILQISIRSTEAGSVWFRKWDGHYNIEEDDRLRFHKEMAERHGW